MKPSSSHDKIHQLTSIVVWVKASHIERFMPFGCGPAAGVALVVVVVVVVDVVVVVVAVVGVGGLQTMAI